MERKDARVGGHVQKQKQGKRRVVSGVLLFFGSRCCCCRLSCRVENVACSPPKEKEDTADCLAFVGALIHLWEEKSEGLTTVESSSADDPDNRPWFRPNMGTWAQNGLGSWDRGRCRAGFDQNRSEHARPVYVAQLLPRAAFGSNHRPTIGKGTARMCLCSRLCFVYTFIVVSGAYLKKCV